MLNVLYIYDMIFPFNTVMSYAKIYHFKLFYFSVPHIGPPNKLTFSFALIIELKK